MSEPAKHHHTVKVEKLLSWVLRGGVVASFVIVVAGTILSFVHHPEFLRSADALGGLSTPGAAFPHSVADVFKGLAAGEGRAVVLFGIMLLIATPVIRVAMSVVIFAYERDRKFVVITSIVLTLLLLSFALGRAGG